MSSYDQAYMAPDEARQVLDALGLTIEQAARLLRISARTMRRYFEGGYMGGDDQAIPGPVEQALRAWLRLHERAQPWRPDTEPLNASAPEQLARRAMLEQHVIEGVHLVRDGGGPTLPWDVDSEWGVARLGSMSLYFYVIPGGGFVPLSYTRQDREPELSRDQPMLEDGIAAIAQFLELAQISTEPAPMVSLAMLRQHGYVMWDDRSPPRYMVRISMQDVAALAEADEADTGTCMRFLTRFRGEIAQIAEREMSHGNFKLLDEVGISMIELDKRALDPAGLHRGVIVNGQLLRRNKTARTHALTPAEEAGLKKKKSDDGGQTP